MASPESLVSVKSGAGSPARSTGQRAIGIVRVSHKGGREADRFGSPMEQRDRIAAECERAGLSLIDVVNEIDVSGGTPLARRRGLREAVERVEAGEADVLVTAFFDRLVRSLVVQHEILSRVEAAGGRILTVDLGEVRTDSSSQWLSATTIGMISEYYRRLSGERSADAKRRAVADGKPPFPRLPFYLRRRRDGRVEHDPDRARLAVEAMERRAAGATVMEVREYLRDRGVRLSFHGVQSFLGSRLLLGELRFGELVNERAFPPVVDAATWRAVQRARVSRGRRAKSERLLARLGVLRCATCGARMVVGTSQGEYAMYRCPPIGDCPRRVTISATAVENSVVDAVKALLEGVEGSASVESGVQDAARELERCESELDAAVRAFTGLEDVDAARERLLALREARDKARERLDELQAAIAPSVTVTAGDWDVLTLDERRALIRAVIDRVEVAPGRGTDRIAVHPRGE